tara:strand:- start:126 stop:368 length:243 start_codon:yes stop_codon:yes gene_type:complete
MSDYYIQSINKTFFLSGSLIYHTDNSGSNANKSNGTLINKDYIIGILSDYDTYNLNIVNFVDMTNEVSGSKLYLTDKEVF